MITVTLNKRKVQIPEGTTILRAAKQLGIDIPTFCNDDRLRFASKDFPLTAGCPGKQAGGGYEAPLVQRCLESGDCKLCSVELDGVDGLPTACNSACEEGMVIWTESPAVEKARKEILLRTLSQHPMDCLNCGKLGECKLQRYCEKYGIDKPLYTVPYDHQPIDDSNGLFCADMDKCISCGKCVRVCKYLMGVGAITMAQYGHSTRVMPASGANLKESACVHCGNCVSVCPVGALMPKSEHKFRVWETHKVRTTCAYCGVGCQMDVLVKNDRVVGVQPADGKANEGLLCVKGKFAFDFINHPARLTEPLARDEDGLLRPVAWDVALDMIVDKIKATREEFGPDAIAGFASARATNEENYLFMKFMRAAVGTNNVDHCARL